jgi:hypothetical protein
MLAWLLLLLPLLLLLSSLRPHLLPLLLLPFVR